MDKTLLLVDDHPLFRRGVKELILSGCELYTEVLEADNGGDALALMEVSSPNCVMLDIAMPGIDGLQALEVIREKFPGVGCVILSMYNNAEFVVDARKKGARGYILKTDSDQTILDCLHSVDNGRDYISPSISQLVEPARPEVAVAIEDIHALSAREKEILGLIAKNQTSREIAQHLGVSVRTVQNHRVNICKKLGISGPNALLKLAIENQAWL